MLIAHVDRKGKHVPAGKLDRDGRSSVLYDAVALLASKKGSDVFQR